jgi:hypothetical protein
VLNNEMESIATQMDGKEQQHEASGTRQQCTQLLKLVADAQQLTALRGYTSKSSWAANWVGFT